jgi:hypothetical protein
MLLQTNSYVVPKDRRNEHARLVRRFRQTLARLGCEHFEVYEQVSQNWGGQDSGGRFVQIMRFRDRRHQLDVQAGERSDPAAQALIQEFCELINFPFQQQQGLFAVGFYSSVLPTNLGREQQTAPQEPAAVAPAPAVPQPQVQPVPVKVQDFPLDQAAGLRAFAEQALAEEAIARKMPETPAEVPPPEPGDSIAGHAEQPVFFDDTPADEAAHARPPQHFGPRLADNDLDSGLTDLSDSNLMNLPELSSSDGPALDETAFSPEIESTIELPAAGESVELHEMEPVLERADARNLPHETDDQAGEQAEVLGNLPDHLEAHHPIEPGHEEDETHSQPPVSYPPMRLARDDDTDGHDGQSDVELFEPDEPVTPFGT